MKVHVLVVKKLSSMFDSVIWSEAVEDDNTEVQVIIPRSLFTEAEIKDIKKDKTLLPKHIFKGNSEHVNLGDNKASLLKGLSFDNFKIEMFDKEISHDDFITSKIEDYSKVVSALVVYKKDTKELVWAEGTEIDGYDYHQMTLPNSLFSDKDIAKLKEENTNIEFNENSVYFGNCEAKDFYNDSLESVFIGKVFFNI
jgi:hypothetical protein